MALQLGGDGEELATWFPVPIHLIRNSPQGGGNTLFKLGPFVNGLV
jgi:hypothetical protein